LVITTTSRKEQLNCRFVEPFGSKGEGKKSERTKLKRAVFSNRISIQV